MVQRWIPMVTPVPLCHLSRSLSWRLLQLTGAIVYSLLQHITGSCVAELSCCQLQQHTHHSSALYCDLRSTSAWSFHFVEKIFLQSLEFRTVPPTSRSTYIAILLSTLLSTLRCHTIAESFLERRLGQVHLNVARRYLEQHALIIITPTWNLSNFLH